MKIKLPKKKAGSYNKSQTPVGTPSTVIPFIDRITVGISFVPSEESEDIHGNIWHQVADIEAFQKATSKGSYNNAWRIKIPSADKPKHYPFMQYRYADGCAARISLTFSPHDLGETGVDSMHMTLRTVIEGGWNAFVDRGRVTMIEVSADFAGVPVDSFHVLPQQTTTLKTWSNNGILETLLFGKRQGNQTRIYDRGKKRISQKQPWSKGDFTRVERVLRAQAIPVAELIDLPNQFSGISLVALPASPPPNEPKGKEYVWHLFCDSVAVRGLPMALKLLPAESYRRRYRKWLKAHQKPWWQPDEIWAQWGPMIEKSRIATADWY